MNNDPGRDKRFHQKQKQGQETYAPPAPLSSQIYLLCCRDFSDLQQYFFYVPWVSATAASYKSSSQGQPFRHKLWHFLPVFLPPGTIMNWRPSHWYGACCMRAHAGCISAVCTEANAQWRLFPNYFLNRGINCLQFQSCDLKKGSCHIFWF